MQAKNMDILVIGDPANINWLTGYDAWSFYTPQIMVVGTELDPTWIGREMDAGAASWAASQGIPDALDLLADLLFPGLAAPTAR